MSLSLVNNKSKLSGDQLSLLDEEQEEARERKTGYLVDEIEMETLRSILTDKAFVYIALQIDCAEGRIKQLNQQYDELAAANFCDRWDFKIENFYAAIEALSKKNAIGVKYRQMTLDLLPPEAEDE